MQKLIHKALEAETRLLNADEAALTLVRKHAQREVSAEEVFLGRMLLSATKADRSHECFTQAHLERFRDTIVGKSVLEGHDTKKRSLGRFYNASVDPHGDGHGLFVDYYANRKNEQLVSDIELGILKHVSIGAYVDDQFICNLCNLDYSGVKSDDGRQCAHQAGHAYDGVTCTVTYAGDLQKYEAVEGSFVFLGAQPDAETVGMTAVHVAKEALLAGQSTGKPPEGETMELKEAQERIAVLEKQIALDAPLIEDGKAYRVFLRSEITRLAGCVEKTAAYANNMRFMGDADAGSLSEVHQEVIKEFEVKFPPQPVGKMGDFKREEQQQEQPRKFDPSRRMPLPVGGK